jgi:predicted RNA-binding Zn-ribbon protein involved in translation (DUF1610 family)
VKKLKTMCQGKSLRLGLYGCPGCGIKLEIFSDEVKVKCYNCGEMVYRENVTPCIDWCVSARKCVAENKNKKGGATC